MSDMRERVWSTEDDALTQEYAEDLYADDDIDDWDESLSCGCCSCCGCMCYLGEDERDDDEE